MDNLDKLRQMAEELHKKDLQLAEEHEFIKMNNYVLQLVTNIFADYINNQDNHKLFSSMLDGLLKITESEYGFIGQVKRDGENIYLQTKAITDISWNAETKKLYDENIANGLKFTNMNTLFGYGILHGITIISNDPSKDYRSSGIPSGHPPLNSFMGLPFFYNGKIVGQIGIANRPNGYNHDLVNLLEPFRLACSTIVAASLYLN
jgi:hypothetical protein